MESKGDSDRPIEDLCITLKNIEFQYRVEDVVTLNTADGSPLGIHYKPTRPDENGKDSALIITEVEDGGLVQKYNEKNQSSKVKPGDYITAANNLMSDATLIKEVMERSGEVNLSVERKIRAEPLLKLDLTIPPGTLVAITGPAACGTSTLLKLMSGKLLPEPGCGEVFLPPHFKVLHLSYKENLWTGPIGESIFFGALTGASQNLHLHQLPEKEVERGLKICKMLNIPDHVINAIEASLDDTNEKTTNDKKEREKARRDSVRAITSLATSTMAKMQLAAALIDNPHVLVISKAFNKFSFADQETVLHALRAFVENRGVEMDPDEYLDRRPRTCVFSSTTPLFLSAADLVYELNEGKLIDTTEKFHQQDAEEQTISQCRRQVHERKDTLQRGRNELIQRLSSDQKLRQPARPYSAEDPPNTAAGTASEKQPLLPNCED